ncbi:MAG: hypothetical protein KGZ71_02055 [Desulfobulbaceae bacterium]|nr:hypothetical protein [Desulfobulbaceae bacterium]
MKYLIIIFSLVVIYNAESSDYCYSIQDTTYIQEMRSLRFVTPGYYIIINIKDSNGLAKYTIPYGRVLVTVREEGLIVDDSWDNKFFHLLTDILVNNDTLVLMKTAMNNSKPYFELSDKYIQVVDSIAQYGVEYFLEHFFLNHEIFGDQYFSGSYKLHISGKEPETILLRNAVIAKLISWRYFVFHGGEGVLFYRKRTPNSE